PANEPLPRMLYTALTDYAKKSGYSLGEEAAQYLVDQAIQNIYRLNDDESKRLSAAQDAIKVETLGTLKQAVAGQTSSTSFPDRNSVVRIMKVCDGPYPWCSKVK